MRIDRDYLISKGWFVRHESSWYDDGVDAWRECDLYIVYDSDGHDVQFAGKTADEAWEDAVKCINEKRLGGHPDIPFALWFIWPDLKTYMSDMNEFMVYG